MTKKSVFMIVGAVLVILIVTILGLASTKPDTFSIHRAARINASPEAIFPLIDDFHRWGAWSPWEKIDPNMKRAHSGAASGKGAIYEWDGNMKAGKGRMEITDDANPSEIRIKLDFSKPVEGHNITEFTLVPQGTSTNVTWTMSGKSAFPSKIMSVFVDMDSLIGKDFETGLANLKAVTEK